MSKAKVVTTIHDEATKAEQAATRLAEEVRELGQALHAKERELAHLQTHASQKRAEADRTP